MIVIVKQKTALTTLEYTDVSNIAYNATTKIYTITHGSPATTVTFSAEDYLVAIMFS